MVLLCGMNRVGALRRAALSVLVGDCLVGRGPSEFFEPNRGWQAHPESSVLGAEAGAGQSKRDKSDGLLRASSERAPVFFFVFLRIDVSGSGLSSGFVPSFFSSLSFGLVLCLSRG
jgi:hypothetical protein